MATAHINASPGDFADTVLMPGDPLRAQYIAETFLDDARRVSDVRNMWGFTGAYKGRPVSVMAHGMGIPSASIYTHELITEYGVKRVMRVGSCGTSLDRQSAELGRLGRLDGDVIGDVVQPVQHLLDLIG